MLRNAFFKRPFVDIFFKIVNALRNVYKHIFIYLQWQDFETDVPEIISSPGNPYNVREEETATLVCRVTDANPSINISWRWYKADRPETILHNGPNYTIANITRGRSGSYSCTASNTVGTSEPATVNMNVQCNFFLSAKQKPFVL